MILLMNVDNENPSEIEGTNTQIEGAGILDFELKGNTHQDSYTGKNLLQNNAVNQTVNGLTFTKNEDGTIKVNGTATAQTVYNINGSVVLNGTYIITGCPSNGADATYFLQIYGTGGINEYGNGATTSNINGVVRIVIRNGATLNNLVFKPMIRLSSVSDSSYEPYTNGPSPNPDYPQDIEVVTGDNTIKVTGKNLFEMPLENGFSNGITWTINENGSITLNGTSTNHINISSQSINMPVVVGETYTISATNLPVGNIGFKETDGTDIWVLTANSLTKTKTITSDMKIQNIRFAIYIPPNRTLDNVTITFQLEKGSATPYQPYQSQTYPINLGTIELCKIGDYQDYIYKENNKWYKKSYVRHISLNVSDMNRSEDYPGWSDVPYLNSDYPNQNIPNFPTSDLITNIGGSRTYFGLNTNGTNGILIMNKNAWNLTQTQWKTNYPNLIFVLYYALATPTNDEITDTDLIEQLEAISNSALFDGVNYIDLNSDNLIGSYKITYSTWYEFEKILRSGYNINEDNDRITQKFANGHRKQFVSDYKDCIITLNLDTIDIDTTKEYLRQLKSGPYKYYSLENKEYKTAQFIIEKRPELKVNNSIGDNTDIDEYQVTLLRAGD